MQIGGVLKLPSSAARVVSWTFRILEAVVLALKVCTVKHPRGASENYSKKAILVFAVFSLMCDCCLVATTSLRRRVTQS